MSIEIIAIETTPENFEKRMGGGEICGRNETV